MSQDYPDRDAWPAYWHAIRTAAAWLVAAAIIVGGGAYLPRPDGALPRFAIEVFIALAVAALATPLARWFNARWEDDAA